MTAVALAIGASLQSADGAPVATVCTVAPEQCASVVLSTITQGYFAPGGVAQVISTQTTGAEALDGDGGGSEAVQESGPAPGLEVLAAIETPTGYIATAPLPGLSDGAYVVVRTGGAISALSADGNLIWHRTSSAFTTRTGRPPPGKSPTTPFILMGNDPLKPFVRAGSRTFAVADLTGDGVADVVVAHGFYAAIGIGGDGAAMVSILDGRSGAFVWSQLYPGHVTNLAVIGQRLIVANETGDHQGPVNAGIGENGSVSALYAWRFQSGADGLIASPAWTVSTGTPWARWLDLVPVGADRVTAAWTATPVGSLDAVHGHIQTLDAATGGQAWSVDTEGYPRVLRYDAGRGEVVVIEQTDPGTTVEASYTLAAFAAQTGAAGARIARTNAIGLNLQVGAAGWLVSELNPAPGGEVAFVSGTVSAINPMLGTATWTQAIGGPASGGAGHPYGLLLPTPNIAIVASLLGNDTIELKALDATTGVPLWTVQSENLLLPLYLSSYQRGGKTLVMGASSRMQLWGTSVYAPLNDLSAVRLQTTTPYHVVRGFDLESGAELATHPLLGEVHALVARDANGDGVADLIVGGESGAVFALDGTTLAQESPRILWQRRVGGPVQEIRWAQLDGSGRATVIAASTRSVDVLNADDGTVRYVLPYANDLVWTVTVEDLDGDGRADLVVPTSTLAAYKGADGSSLWTYQPDSLTKPYFSTAAVAPGRRVAVQYLTSDPFGGGPGNYTGLLLAGASGAVLWSHSATTGTATPDLWRGANVGELAGAPGPVAAFTRDPNFATSNPVVDLYDIDSGALRFSSAPSAGVSNKGTTFVPGIGFEAYNFGAPSLLVTPSASRDNFRTSVTDLKVATLGTLGERVVYGAHPLWLGVGTSTALDPAPASLAQLHRQNRFVSGAVELVDLDQDGQHEIAVLPFNWDGFSNVSMVEGRFSYSQDLFLHGLTLLGVSGTQAVPDPFTFIERAGVATNVFVTSESKTLGGFSGLLPVSVASNGQYRINSGAWTGLAGQIGAGDKLAVRHISASAGGTANETLVTVGAYSTTFRSVTSSLDRTPDAFGFGTKTGVDPGVPVESNVVTLSGFNTGISIVPGSGIAYRIGGGAWTTATGTLQQGQTLQVRHTSSTTSLGYTKTYLKVGGVTGYFTTRTQ